jgi:hypothetical protein
VPLLANATDPAKAIDDLKMEYAAVKLQLDRHDRWIRELAEKVGVELKD